MPLPKTIKRSKLVEFYMALADVKTHVSEISHRWRAAAMRKQLEPTVLPIIEQRDDVARSQPTEFDSERHELCAVFSKKLPDGKPIIEKDNYVIDESRRTEFDAQMAQLQNKFRERQKKFAADVKKINAFLDEVIDMPAVGGSFKLFWFAATTPQELLEALYDVIEDGELEKPPQIDEVAAAKKASKKGR